MTIWIETVSDIHLMIFVLPPTFHLEIPIEQSNGALRIARHVNKHTSNAAKPEKS